MLKILEAPLQFRPISWINRELRGSQVWSGEEVHGAQGTSEVRLQPRVQGAERRWSGLRNGREKLQESVQAEKTRLQEGQPRVSGRLQRPLPKWVCMNVMESLSHRVFLIEPPPIQPFQITKPRAACPVIEFNWTFDIELNTRSVRPRSVALT